MKKNQIIFTLPLTEVAKIARKSTRTIRRWCQKGFIQGARCSRGGHWSVRVFLSGKDEQIAKRRARQAGGSREDLERELWIRTQERVWDIVAPSRIPSGFERHKKIPKPTEEEVTEGRRQFLSLFLGEEVELVPVKNAWETAAAFEWAESFGHGKSLLPVMEKVKRIGFMPVPRECFDYPMKPEVQTALEAAPHKPMFMAFYGAALNLLQSTGRCSVSKVCRKLGVSRATAYRHGLADAVNTARRESGRDLTKTAMPDDASESERRAWESGRAKNTVHRDPEKMVVAVKRRR
jgi:predicted site-specific integrase-resolvase